ncbi:CLUMA_CG010949, isoform A [Clunio marinus]|uniref:CLUMA_CG010949, isoform A n=1 Tax=Clunio marinus TaxID=568069 RepID=A0A1J1IBH4_9DIPT|nr:CLUMA_CG010949, isoform A [Clunio marinus]
MDVKNKNRKSQERGNDESRFMVQHGRTDRHVKSSHTLNYLQSCFQNGNFILLIKQVLIIGGSKPKAEQRQKHKREQKFVAKLAHNKIEINLDNLFEHLAHEIFDSTQTLL